MLQIERIMNEVNGTTFVGLDTETPVKLAGGKKNPLQGRVTKRVTGSNVMVFQNNSNSGYGQMVERRLEREGKDPSSFSLQPRKWGERRVGSPFVDHKGKLYLEVIFLSAGEAEYLVDGEVADPATIEGLPPRKEEAEQGGLNNKVIIRTYNVENIRRVRINRQNYDL